MADKIKIKFKDKNLKKAIADIEKVYGVTLMAKNASDTVNGYINFYEEGGGVVAEVFFYDYNKAPDFQLYEKNGVMYSEGSKITIEKAVINKDKNK